MTGILITGPSGSGKTTLGQLLARELGYTYVDIDDCIWRKDTALPFSAMYSREEKISRVRSAISVGEHFVMAGSMDSFHEHFDPYFDLAVLLQADAVLRVGRVHDRAIRRFGKRVLEGGDMHAAHQRMLRDIAGYGHGIGSCTLQRHEAWLSTLPCRVMRLDGADPLEKNLRLITDACRALHLLPVPD